MRNEKLEFMSSYWEFRDFDVLLHFISTPFHGLLCMHVGEMFSIVYIQNFNILVYMLVHSPILFFVEFGVLLNWV